MRRQPKSLAKRKRRVTIPNRGKARRRRNSHVVDVTPQQLESIRKIAERQEELVGALRDAVGYLDHPPTAWTYAEIRRLNEIRKLASSC